jgi:hypothetical protein
VPRRSAHHVIAKASSEIKLMVNIVCPSSPPRFPVILSLHDCDWLFVGTTRQYQFMPLRPSLLPLSRSRSWTVDFGASGSVDPPGYELYHWHEFVWYNRVAQESNARCTERYQCVFTKGWLLSVEESIAA